LRLNAQEMLLFSREADRILNQNEKSRIMELTTSWKEEGIAEGIVKGLEQGLERGLERGRREEGQQLVFRLLRRRWGMLPSALHSQVEALSLVEMENLAEALLDFTALADLEKWLQKR